MHLVCTKKTKDVQRELSLLDMFFSRFIQSNKCFVKFHTHTHTHTLSMLQHNGKHNELLYFLKNNNCSYLEINGIKKQISFQISRKTSHYYLCYFFLKFSSSSLHKIWNNKLKIRMKCLGIKLMIKMEIGIFVSDTEWLNYSVRISNYTIDVIANDEMMILMMRVSLISLQHTNLTLIFGCFEVAIRDSERTSHFRNTQPPPPLGIQHAL